MTDARPLEEARDLSHLITVTHVVYGLMVLSFVTVVSAIVGVIINYVKLDEVRGTWLESHFRWQIRTFWFALLWTIAGWILLLTVVLPWIIWGATAVWVIYRIAKGWLALSERKPLLL
jgi:uncharacterized membrane protein